MGRARELAADQGGALLTGRPSDLAAALVRISGELGRIPLTDLRAQPRAVTVLGFMPVPNNVASRRAAWWGHPGLETRLEQLARMARQ